MQNNYIYTALNTGEYLTPQPVKLLISGNYNAITQECYDFNGVYLASGIYKGSYNGENIYLGSTARGFNKRIIKEHFYDLENQIHSNTYFQNSWNKYGENNFVWWALEIVEDKNIVLQREDYYLDAIKPFIRLNRGYNIQESAIHSNLGRKFSEEVRRKNSESHLKLNYKHTEEWKQNMSKKMSGENHYLFGKEMSQEVKNKISKTKTGISLSPEIIESRCKFTCYFISPVLKNIYIIYNLEKFCRESKLHAGHMLEIWKEQKKANGNNFAYRGWQKFKGDISKVDPSIIVEQLHPFDKQEENILNEKVISVRDNLNYVPNGAKLTWETVREIRYRYSVEQITQIQLSREYKISKSVLNNVISGKIWKEKG